MPNQPSLQIFDFTRPHALTVLINGCISSISTRDGGREG